MLINTALFFLPHPHLLFPICCLQLPLKCELFGAAIIFYSTYPAKHSRGPPHDCGYKGATILQINSKKLSHHFSLPKGSTGFAFLHRVLSSELFLITKWKKKPKKTPTIPLPFLAGLNVKKLRYPEDMFLGWFWIFLPKGTVRGEGEHSR